MNRNITIVALIVAYLVGIVRYHRIEYLIPTIIVALLITFLWGGVNMMRQGKEALKSGGLRSILSRVTGVIIVIVVSVLTLLVSLHYFAEADITRYHDLFEDQVTEVIPALSGAVLGDSTAVATLGSSMREKVKTAKETVLSKPTEVERMRSALEELTLNRKLDAKGRAYVASMDSILTHSTLEDHASVAIMNSLLANLTTLLGPRIDEDSDNDDKASTKNHSSNKKDESGFLAKLNKGLLILIMSVLGVLALWHGFWSDRKINKPVDWNINPEGENTDPQKNYYGIWGSRLFHFFLFLMVSPTSYLLHSIKVPVYIDVVMLLILVLFVMKQTGHLSSLEKFKELVTTGGRVKQGLIILVSLALIFVLRLKVSSMITVFVLLLGSWILAGCYEVHIRGRLVLLIKKKPVYSRFWLLGKKYLNNGLNVTLLPVFLWRHEQFLVDYSVWEVNKIETDPIPTKGEPKQKAIPEQGDQPAIPAKKAVPGLPIKLVVNPTLQIVDPVVYLEMDTSDRVDRHVLPEVVKRRILNGLRDAGQQFTYEDIKTENVLQFPVRLQDLELMSQDHPLRALYLERAVFWIKVAVGNDYEYVKNDKEGVFRSATYFEYQDWVLRTLMGCSLVEVGVLDATNTKAEEAEERLKISELEKKIQENLGIAAGKSEAARIKQIAALMSSENKDQNELAVNMLTKLAGADNAGLLFQLFQGLSNKINPDSSVAPDSSGD
jgi:hypothetical protein